MFSFTAAALLMFEYLIVVFGYDLIYTNFDSILDTWTCDRIHVVVFTLVLSILSLFEIPNLGPRGTAVAAKLAIVVFASLIGIGMIAATL